MQVTFRDQVAANATVRNALADTDLAIAPSFGFMTIYGRQETTSGGELLVSFSMGSTEVDIESPVTQNNALTPNRQDDIISGPHPVLPGKSLRSKVQEIAGFATDNRLVYNFVEADKVTVLRAMGARI